MTHRPLTAPLVAALACFVSTAIVRAESPKEPLVVFLVRHGEKVDLSTDAKLSAAGRERAETLSSALRSAKVKYVHSTDYIRTRDTAAPLAAAQRLKVQLYNARQLPALVAKIRRLGGRHLVVGHSSSTPRMAKLLGGEPGTAINEPAEFDRLYVLTFSKDGEVTTVQMRYGD